MNDFIKQRRPHNGMIYEEFESYTISEAQKELDNLSALELRRVEFTKLNIARANRIIKTFKANQELEFTLNKIKGKQIWMVLTEPWCGDSAQILPYIHLYTKDRPNISLRILLRDQNLDIMNQYLINGSKSIPILVVFDEEGNEMLRWGPRPKNAQKLISKLKEDGLTKNEWTEKLHGYYAKNKGTDIVNEFIEILSVI
ncbi:MAG: thioredoxin family protein [Melioribacteraceae bacterium]|nr:thioredoxin family protein [Melioribacteraceae bacterium]